MSRLRPAPEPLQAFCGMLRDLRIDAGNPTLQALRAAMPRRPGMATLSDLLNARISTPPEWDLVAEFVTACASFAKNSTPVRALAPTSVDLRAWQVRHVDLERQLDTLARQPNPNAAVPRGRAVRSTMPHDVVGFTGRQREIDRLVATARLADAGSIMGICVVDGMAGVGKTALAVHAAGQMTDLFPDGRLFLELRAHSAPRPVSPADALDVLLRTIGVEPQAVPSGLDERAALWRDRLAGRRVLVVLDDATGHDQVRPLLPGAPGCCVVITSRRRISTLAGATAVSLDVMPPEDAGELFTSLAPSAADEPTSTAEVVRLAGYLPLAICLLAGKLRSRPAWTAMDLAHELTSTLDRSQAIRADDVIVGTAFDLSYLALPEPVRQLFTALGSHPGVDVDAHVAAALSGCDADDAARGLDLLYENHLVREPVRGRYQFHDLVHDYARRLAAGRPAGEVDAAHNRVLDHYLAMASAMDASLRGRPRDGLPGTTYDEALARLNVELLNLCACVEFAGSAQNSRVVALGHVLSTFLRRQGHWSKARMIHGRARAAARATGDRAGEAGALQDLGTLHRASGDFPAATACLLEALALREEIGEPLAVAAVHLKLGTVHRHLGDFAAAETHLKNALDGYGERHQDDDSAIIARHELGIVRSLTGDHASAIAFNEKALAAIRRFGDQVREAGVRLALGVARSRAGEHSAAEHDIAAALAVYRQAKDEDGEAEALEQLGRLRGRAGDLAGARDHHTSSLALYTELGNRGGQAEALNSLGALTDDDALATRRHQEALRLAMAVGSRPEEARACEGLGRRLAGSDRVRYLRRALELYERMGMAEASLVDGALTDAEQQPERDQR